MVRLESHSSPSSCCTNNNSPTLFLFPRSIVFFTENNKGDQCGGEQGTNPRESGTDGLGVWSIPIPKPACGGSKRYLYIRNAPRYWRGVMLFKCNSLRPLLLAISVGLLAFARLSSAQSPQSLSVPPDSPHWELDGNAKPVEFLGRKCLM